jgi:methylmalonyl-CoA/ethylmalonyl-CoA epimerase
MENDWSLEHLGLVIRDIDKAVKLWQSLGAVCFRPRGNCFIRIDTLTMELHTSQDEHTSEGFRKVLKQFYDKHGEGVQHLDFSVGDLEYEKIHMNKLGFPAIHISSRPELNFFEAHYDTYKIGGVSIAMIKKPVPSDLVFSPTKSNWRFDHLGFVVRDIDRAIEFYQSLGMVVLCPVTESVQGGECIEVHSKAPVKTIKNKRTFLQKGSLIMELCQPVEGDSMHKEFIERHGEGVEHIHFSVNNIETEKANMVEKGFTVITNIRKTKDSDLIDTYFDTRKDFGNIIIALTQTPVLEYLIKKT